MIDAILSPIMWIIAWVLYIVHKFFAIFFSEGAGPAWVLAIIGLTVVVRVAILPLYNKKKFKNNVRDTDSL